MKYTTSYQKHCQQVLEEEKKHQKKFDNPQPEFSSPTWKDYFRGLAFLAFILIIGYAVLMVAGGSAPIQVQEVTQ